MRYENAMVYGPDFRFHKGGFLVENGRFCSVLAADDQPEIDVDAVMLFMMAIEDPKEQLSNLKTIMRMFTNKEAVSAFVQAASREELVKAVAAYLK